MNLRFTRRDALKAGAAAIAGAAVLPALATSAEAAAPKILPIGTASIVRLWGTKTVKVNGVKVKVPNTKPIYIGTDTKVLNKGGLCNWVGTAAPLTIGNCVFFGHRTTHGGLLRKLNTMVVGDEIIVTIGTQSKKYRVVEPPLVVGGKDSDSVLRWGPTDKANVTLVSCTKPNKQPTSTKFRLLVRATEV
jgi:LPXTG-site transpeptidase (sortase) family protein